MLVGFQHFKKRVFRLRAWMYTLRAVRVWLIAVLFCTADLGHTALHGPIRVVYLFTADLFCTVMRDMGVDLLTVCILFACEDFVVELQLDSVKPSQKESVRRTLFLDSQQPSLLMNFSLSDGGRSCHDTQIYLRVSHTVLGVFFCKTANFNMSTTFYQSENKCLTNARSCASVNLGVQIT